MQVLVFLLLMAACHGIPLDIQKAPQLLLPMPELKRLETKDDPNNSTIHRKIATWSAVESGDPDNPILGYKKIDNNVIPDGVPQEFVTPANVTTATVQDVYEGVAYQFAVQAFTAQGDGPLSAPTRIRIIPEHELNTNAEDLLGKKETRY